MHRVEDHVIRSRKRPKKTSTNAAIVRPAFGDLAIKDLPIPTLIDVYNHHMNGVNLANQIRRSFTCQRPHQLKWWRPIAFGSLISVPITHFLFGSEMLVSGVLGTRQSTMLAGVLIEKC